MVPTFFVQFRGEPFNFRGTVFDMARIKFVIVVVVETTVSSGRKGKWPFHFLFGNEKRWDPLRF